MAGSAQVRWDRASFATAVAAFALLTLGTAGPVSGGDPWPRTGERWRSPVCGEEFLLERNRDNGEKALVAADGRRFRSVDDAARAEAARFPRRELVLDQRLREAAEDPARRDLPTGVILVFGRQPAHEAGESARRRHGPRFSELLLRGRAILGRIAGERTPDPEGAVQLGPRMEEEARLLAPEDASALRALAEECRELRRRMRREVLEEARAEALPLQAPLASWIESRPDARVLARGAILCSVTASLPPRSLEEIVERFPGVHRVVPVESVEPTLDTSVPAVGAASWTGAGYSGSSATKVAVIDSGIDSGHPAFAGGVVGDASVHLAYAASLPGGTSAFGDDASDPDDLYYHGTHVGGFIASNDSKYRGVAPGARLMNAKAFYKTVGGFANAFDPDILDAGDWAADHGADVVNCSFGFAGATYGNSTLALFFDALVHDLGISTTVSAGNAGPSSGTIRTPADAFNVVAVGNVNFQRTAGPSDDLIHSTSSRGPLTDGRRKPDLSAPGTLVYSCWHEWESQADFVVSTGTSMAAPHVAGGLALVEDFNASWLPEAAKALLLVNARNGAPYPATPDDDWGHGGLDLAAAFTNRAAVAEGGLDSDGSPVAFFRGPALGAGGRVTLCWNRQVVSNGSDAPTTYYAAADLDLHLYDGTSGAAGGSSLSGLDNVEQVRLAGPLVSTVIKVERSGPLPSGVTRQEFGLAAEAATALTAVGAPSLRCTFVGTPLVVGPETSFPVTVAVENAGGLPAFSPSATLVLPAGYLLVAGANPRTLARIDGSSIQVCSWTVRSPGAGAPRGPGTIQVSVASSSFGETIEGAAEFEQDFEPSPPSGALSIEGGAAFVADPAVTLEAQASGGEGAVVEMRFGNDATSWTGWSDWEAFAPTRDWDLAPGPDGGRTVWGQVRDSEGNASLLFSDAVSLDRAAPAMTFVLNGGAPYVVPSVPLRADAATSDGGGSGASEFRASHDGGATWSEWIPLDVSGSAEIPRPPGRGQRTVAGQVRDRVGHLSPVRTARIHVAEDDPQPLTDAGRFRGSFLEGGDVDTFGVDLIEGDRLTITGRVELPDRDAEIGIAFDLWDPGGLPVSAGRFPQDSAREGVRGFTAAATGLHLLVVRPVGFDAERECAYALRVRVRRSRAQRGFEGESVAGVIAFPAARGESVSGAFRGTSKATADLEPPGGNPVGIALVGTDRVRVLRALQLDGPTGTWELRLGSEEQVHYRLRVRPPRRRSVDEEADLAGP